MAHRCRPRKLTELELRSWIALPRRLLVQAAQLSGALLKAHLSGGGGWNTVWAHQQTG